MSKTNRLRQLTKKTPQSHEEIESIIDTLREAPDLAAAITGAALAETGLQARLEKNMRPLTRDERDRMFGDRGPLGSFSSKILVAKAFSLITGPMAEEYNTVRNIRNVFAHSRYPLTFDDPALAEEVLAMKMCSAIRKGPMDPPLSLTNKQWFVLTVRLLLIVTTFSDKDNPGENASSTILASEG